MISKEIIVAELRHAIVTGEFAPGERLKETAICQRFKVSRTPVREALKELESEGLTKTTLNRGSRVVSFSYDDVSNIYDMLIFIDGAACRMVCTRISSEELHRLEDIHVRLMEAATKRNYDVVSELNVQFHRLIAEATRNPYLIEIHSNFRQLISCVVHFSSFNPSQLSTIVSDHSRIIEALAKKNEALAEIVAREHVEKARETMLRHLHSWHGDAGFTRRSA
jgi:DNA-binding GntR family transcriptional regulator